MGKQSAPLDGDLQRTYRGRAWRDEEPNRRLLLDTNVEEKAVLNWTMPVCYPAQVYADNGNSN